MCAGVGDRTSLALRVKDGVVFAVEKLFSSSLLVAGSDRRIFPLDKHMGMTASGLIGDIRHLFNRARNEAEAYKGNYAVPISVKLEAERVAAYAGAFTLYGGVRPFGATVLIGGIDVSGPQLYMVDPAGITWGYFGAATGKARQAAKTEIEKLDLQNMDARTAVIEAAKIIHKVHDESKDKLFELELAWICPDSKNTFQMVPRDLFLEAEDIAKKAVKEAEEGDDEDDEAEPAE